MNVDQRHDVRISLGRWSTSEARVVDDLWDLIEPLLPSRPDKAPGRRPVPDEVYAPTVGEFSPGSPRSRGLRSGIRPTRRT
jgi:hypothetical protein